MRGGGLDELVLLIPCPRCHAWPGEGCVTSSGRPVGHYCHAQRNRPVYEAYGQGYIDASRVYEEREERRRAAVHPG